MNSMLGTVVGKDWAGADGRLAFEAPPRKNFPQSVDAHVEDIRRIGLLFHGAIRRQPNLDGLVELSSREREILTWVAAGKGSKVIARRLKRSTRTVEHHIASARNHIASARNRLGAHNRTHAVAKALALNLIQVLSMRVRTSNMIISLTDDSEREENEVRDVRMRAQNLRQWPDMQPRSYARSVVAEPLNILCL